MGSFKRIITTTLTAVLFIELGAFPAWKSRADEDPDHGSLQEQMNEQKTQIRQEQARLKLAETEFSELSGEGVDLDRYPEFGGSCDCSCQCPQARLYESAGYRLEDIQSGTTPPTCMILYQNQQVYSSLPEACATAVRKCGKVKLELRRKQLKAEIDHLTRSIEEDKNTLAEIRRDYSRQRNNCPDCDLKAAMRGRPSTGELLLSGFVNGVVPLLGIGANAYLGSKAIGGYYGAYNNYLQQCMTVGVPCAGPGLGLAGIPTGLYGGMGIGGGMGISAGLGFGLSPWAAPYYGAMGAGIGWPASGLYPGIGLAGAFPNYPFGYPGAPFSPYGLSASLGGGFSGPWMPSPFFSGNFSAGLPGSFGFQGNPNPMIGPFSPSGGYGPYIGFPGQYPSMYAASMQQQLLSWQRAQQQEEDIMLAQHQIYEAQQRYLQSWQGWGAGIYGGFGTGMNTGFGSFASPWPGRSGPF